MATKMLSLTMTRSAEMGWTTDMQGSITIPMSATEIRDLVNIEDHLSDLTGQSYSFVSLQDAEQFASNIEYYMETEGYSADMAEEFTKRDMGL